MLEAIKQRLISKSDWLRKYWTYLRYFLLMFAILNTLFYLVYHSRINYDEIMQLGAMRSFLDGQSLAMRRSTVEDLSSIQYTPLLKLFPPAYAMTMAMVYKVIGDLGLSDIILKALGVILFYLSWFFILEKIGGLIGFWPRLFIWLYWGLVFSPIMVPMWTAHTSGMLSLAFISVNIAFCLHGIRSGQVRITPVAAGGVFMGMAMAMRYAYLPMGVIVSLAFFITAVLDRQSWKPFLTAALTNITVALTVCCGMFSYNYIVFNKIIGMRKIVPGIHWDNLGWMIPFPAHAFGLMDRSYFGSLGLERRISMPDIIPVQGITVAVSLVIATAYLYLSFIVFKRCHDLKKVKGESGKNGMDRVLPFLILVGLLTIIVNVVFLAALSVKSNMFNFRGGWMFVAELRYYSATLTFFMIAAVIVVSGRSIWRVGYWGRMMAFLLGIIIIFSIVMVGGWRCGLTVKQIMKPHTFKYGLGRCLGRENALNDSMMEIKKMPGGEYIPIVVITKKTMINTRAVAMMLGALDCPVKNISKDLELRSSRPVVVLFVWNKNVEDVKIIESLVDRYQGNKIKETANTLIYFFRVG